jgi:glutathione-regulated potassium-efflux system ancillary protein KefG
MSPLVHTRHLIDAQGVARLLRLSHANSVSTYLRRYPDMPRPVLDLGQGRPRLWLRPAILKWAKRRVREEGARP